MYISRLYTEEFYKNIKMLEFDYGIYMFCAYNVYDADNPTPYYIGKSKTLKTRVFSSMNEQENNFVEDKEFIYAVSIVPCKSLLDLKIAETLMISHYQPKYNVQNKYIGELSFNIPMEQFIVSIVTFKTNIGGLL